MYFLTFLEGNGWATEKGQRGVSSLLGKLRKRVVRSGAGNPYLVAMTFDPEGEGKVLLSSGEVDALTSYAVLCDDGNKAPFQALTRCARRYWERFRDVGGQVVPIATAGWDRRPRIERPVPWEPTQIPGEGVESFYETATPEQLVGHFRETVEWMAENRAVTPANTLLIYAWNENDEGGRLVPTLGEGDQRVKAVGSYFNSLQSSTGRGD